MDPITSASCSLQSPTRRNTETGTASSRATSQWREIGVTRGLVVYGAATTIGIGERLREGRVRAVRLVNRLALGPYGGRAVATPNFARLAARAATFERHHVGSLPCMPARRNLQTGRLSFLHRCWGPPEPFDDAFPELLCRAGVYSHLADPCHSWKDGGATCHDRFDSFELWPASSGPARGLPTPRPRAPDPDPRRRASPTPEAPAGGRLNRSSLS